MTGDRQELAGEGTIIDGVVIIDGQQVPVAISIGTGAPQLTATDHLEAVQAQIKALLNGQQPRRVDLKQEVQGGVAVRDIFAPRYRLMVHAGVVFKTLPPEITQILERPRRLAAILAFIAST